MWNEGRVREIMTLRLNMIELDCNYERKDLCKVCGREESNEYTLKCREIMKIIEQKK